MVSRWAVRPEAFLTKAHLKLLLKQKDHCQQGNEEKRDAQPDKRDQTDESKHADDVHLKSVISYKEYKARKAVEQGASAADKSTPEEEEDWDAEPSLPPWDPPPGASSMAPSQEDEWKRMISQDPCSGSITGDSAQHNDCNRGN